MLIWNRSDEKPPCATVSRQTGFHSDTTCASTPVSTHPLTTPTSAPESSGEFCDTHYTELQDREGCWWRYHQGLPSETIPQPTSTLMALPVFDAVCMVDTMVTNPIAFDIQYNHKTAWVTGAIFRSVKKSETGIEVELITKKLAADWPAWYLRRTRAYCMMEDTPHNASVMSRMVVDSSLAMIGRVSRYSQTQDDGHTYHFVVLLDCTIE